MKKGIYKSMLLATLTMAGFTAVVTPSNTIEAKSVLKKTFKVGKTATYRGLSLKVNSFQYVEPGEYDSIDEGKHFIVANVTITNKSRKSYDYNPYDFKLNVNGNNTDFDAYPDAVENLLDSGTLDKGASVTGNLAAEIKQGATNPKLKMNVNVLDDSKNITFSLK
ncbi:hypothetical protein A8C40_04770 [Ligilactobacillus salivarius]|uniref:DUF4352 domain-containing protein n=1 Tax=Ligilactobacillus salivarius TaxID=1624 RepID=UPI000BAFFF53|nr:DUF4352 domain-containing protein [Ligilactobacillus salivarius]PAY58971.1 hypothetical protein A8C41_03575 [Ligilactobacillus salivarius]PAY60470.1 hypothetical protein A8C40_04770 [Ligilactobacillus salivarius]